MLTVRLGKRKVHALAFSPDGQWLAAGLEMSVVLLEAATGRVVWSSSPSAVMPRSRPHRATTPAVGWDAGCRLMATLHTGAAVVWDDPESGVPAQIPLASIGPDRRWEFGLLPTIRYATAQWAPAVPACSLYRGALLDRGGNCFGRIEDARPPGPGWWDAENQVLYFGGWAAGVMVIRFAEGSSPEGGTGLVPLNGQLGVPTDVGAAPLLPIKWLPGLPFLCWPVGVGRGGMVVCANDRNRVSLWRPMYGIVPEFDAPFVELKAGAFSPDGALAAVGGTGGVVIWDLDP